MSDSYKVRRVFIASPGDVQKEREIFKEIIDEVNDIKAHHMGIHLEALAWEDTLPGRGRPQEIINKDIKRSDYVVMLLWKRWGTPTGKYSSGFEEEYHIAESQLEKGKIHDIALYFRSIPDNMLEDPGEHLKKVLAFRETIESEKKFFCRPYEDERGWEKFIRARLCGWLDDFGGEGIKAPSEMDSQSVELPAELVWDISNTLVREAVKKAENGELTKAEEYFIKATTLSFDTQVLNLYAQFLHRIGLLDKAEEKLKQVAYIGEKTEDKGTLALAYGNLGILYKTRGESDKAEEMYEKSLAINIELGTKEGMASAYGNLGNIYSTRGALGKAEEMYGKSLAVNEKLGSKKGMAKVYGNLGIIYSIRGDLKKAEEMQKKSLAINEKLGSEEGMAKAYGNLGNIYIIRKDLGKAEEMQKKSLAIEEKLGSKEGMAIAYGNLGIISSTRGYLKKAEEMYGKSLDISKELGSKEGMARAYCNLGIIYKTRGDIVGAEEMYGKSLAINKELGSKEGIANAYGNFGTLYKTSGNIGKAEEMYRKSLHCFTSLGNKSMIEKATKLLRELRKKK